MPVHVFQLFMNIPICASNKTIVFIQLSTAMLCQSPDSLHFLNSKEILFIICFKNFKGLSRQFAYVTSLTEQGLAN